MQKSCQNIISITSQLEENTVWLAEKLSGMDKQRKEVPRRDEKNIPSGHFNENTFDSDIVGSIHASLQEQLRYVKQFRIDKCLLISLQNV